jgi:hypothetical protein
LARRITAVARHIQALEDELNSGEPGANLARNSQSLSGEGDSSLPI